MTHMFISSFLEMTTLHIILYCGLVSVTHCSRLLMMTNNNRKYLKNLNGSKKYIIGKNLLVLHTSRTKISFQRFIFFELRSPSREMMPAFCKMLGGQRDALVNFVYKRVIRLQH